MEATVNPMVIKWIDQMDDPDQSSAYYAYQCLEREVLRSSKPGNDAAVAALAKALAEALVAVKAQDGDQEKPARKAHTTLARNQLARLLSYIPNDEVLPQLGKAVHDYDVREMVRYALDANRSDGATSLLAEALESHGPVFRVGVVNSLARREGAIAQQALSKAADDPQPEVRIAARLGLAEFPVQSHDAAISKGLDAGSAEERRQANIARARLAETLRMHGNKTGAKEVAEAILAGDADEAQKKAAQNTLAQC